jgi:hypothetical protein
MLKDWDHLAAHYSSAQDNDYFGWTDVKEDTVQQLAQKFAERFPDIVAASHGDDWNYAGWYVRMLGYAERELFPIAYDDWGGKHPNPRFMPLSGCESDLLMPPPGDADDKESQDD